jgi:hypothetical protein
MARKLSQSVQRQSRLQGLLNDLDPGENVPENAPPEGDLEYDLRSTNWICAKVRNSDAYAQNLYAAMCNMRFQRQDVLPILRDEFWSCSWRHAGGIIADMRESGDYMDWYCSGIGEGLGNGDADGSRGYVPEATVTDEVREDLLKLGWVPCEWPDDYGV